MASHGYFGRLLFQYASFSNSRALHFFLAIWPVVGIWLTSAVKNGIALNILNGITRRQNGSTYAKARIRLSKSGTQAAREKAGLLKRSRLLEFGKL